jgi:hypothetical protein
MNLSLAQDDVFGDKLPKDIKSLIKDPLTTIPTTMNSKSSFDANHVASYLIEFYNGIVYGVNSNSNQRKEIDKDYANFIKQIENNTDFEEIYKIQGNSIEELFNNFERKRYSILEMENGKNLYVMINYSLQILKNRSKENDKNIFKYQLYNPFSTKGPNSNYSDDFFTNNSVGCLASVWTC